MKYLHIIISFLIPQINFVVDNFNNFYDSLQEETEEFIEELGSYYLEGILNYTYDGCLDESICEQFLNEFDNVARGLVKWLD